MRKFVLILLLLIALPAGAQERASSWQDTYTGGTSGSGFFPTNSINQTPGATLSTPGASVGVPGSVGEYTPLEPIFNKWGGTKYNTFSDYLSTVYKLAVTVGALIAVVMLVTGGVRYMLSEGFTDIDKAKLRIRSALTGLLILVGSFLILYTINPNLLNFTLLNKLPELKQQGPSNFSVATGGSGGSNSGKLTNEQTQKLLEFYKSNPMYLCSATRCAKEITGTIVESIFSLDDVKGAFGEKSERMKQFINECSSSGGQTETLANYPNGLIGPSEFLTICGKY